MSVIIFVAGILFALRAMPGPGFAAGAAGALVILTLTDRLVTRKRLMPRFSVPPRLNLYVALGILLAAAGIAVAIRAAWLVDVQAVQAAAHSAMAGN
jgi:multisubunit Na+/H+ antiporter MnhB subunit